MLAVYVGTEKTYQLFGFVAVQGSWWPEGIASLPVVPEKCDGSMTLRRDATRGKCESYDRYQQWKL